MSVQRTLFHKNVFFTELPSFYLHQHKLTIGTSFHCFCCSYREYKLDTVEIHIYYWENSKCTPEDHSMAFINCHLLPSVRTLDSYKVLVILNIIHTKAAQSHPHKVRIELTGKCFTSLLLIIPLNIILSYGDLG